MWDNTINVCPSSGGVACMVTVRDYWCGTTQSTCAPSSGGVACMVTQSGTTGVGQHNQRVPPLVEVWPAW